MYYYNIQYRKDRLGLPSQYGIPGNGKYGICKNLHLCFLYFVHIWKSRAIIITNFIFNSESEKEGLQKEKNVKWETPSVWENDNSNNSIHQVKSIFWNGDARGRFYFHCSYIKCNKWMSVYILMSVCKPLLPQKIKQEGRVS